MKLDGLQFIDGTTLKILALLAMTLDHIGYFLLPEVESLRIVGRLAYPIFAYLLVEGCEHTRNKQRYFGSVLGVGVLCSVVSYVVDGSLYQSIMITFALAILMIYTLKYVVHVSKNGDTVRVDIARLLAMGLAVAMYALGSGKFVSELVVDYGFLGIVTPALAALGANRLQRLCLLTLGLVLLAVELGGVQIFSLAAVLLLLLYNGQRGGGVGKSFFYAYYPLHIAVICGLAQVLGV